LILSHPLQLAISAIFAATVQTHRASKRENRKSWHLIMKIGDSGFCYWQVRIRQQKHYTSAEKINQKNLTCLHDAGVEFAALKVARSSRPIIQHETNMTCQQRPTMNKITTSR
jgi:hypothetical protein